MFLSRKCVKSYRQWEFWKHRQSKRITPTNHCRGGKKIELFSIFPYPREFDLLCASRGTDIFLVAHESGWLSPGSALARKEADASIITQKTLWVKLFNAGINYQSSPHVLNIQHMVNRWSTIELLTFYYPADLGVCRLHLSETVCNRLDKEA